MKCDCNCNGKCKMLGALEQKIMEVLWSSPKPLKPSEVLALLPKEKTTYAYTTIMTVLKRMADKKIVKRESKGNVFYYASFLSKDDFAATALDDLFRRLFASYGDHTVTAFKKAASESGFSL